MKKQVFDFKLKKWIFIANIVESGRDLFRNWIGIFRGGSLVRSKKIKQFGN